MLAKDIFRIDMAQGYLLGALHRDLRLAAAGGDGSRRGAPRYRYVSQFPFLRLGLPAARVCRPEPAAGLRCAGGLLGPCHRRPRNPGAVDGARVSSSGRWFGRSIWSASSTSLWIRRERSSWTCPPRQGNLVRLRDPHSLRTSAFPDAPRRALAACATGARVGSVGQRADVGRRD
jgi:hypothetical protein